MSIKKLSGRLAFFAEQCINTCISFAKALLHFPFRSKLPASLAESCVILGNGPSLSHSLHLHMDFFKKHPLFAVNSFAMTDAYTVLKPSNYVILDPGFWMHSGKQVTDTLDALRINTGWPLELFVPTQARKSELFKTLAQANPHIRLNYYNYTVYKGFKSPGYFFFKKNLAMPQCQNVLAAAVFLGINTGYKAVYIFGADHSWHESLYVNDENIVCVKQVHFYDEEQKVSYHPFYKGPHIRETFRMDEIFHTFGKAFYSYRVLSDYAVSRGCMIYNASETSAIDAFKRIKL